MDEVKQGKEAFAELTAYRRDRFSLIASVFSCESTKEAVAGMVAQASEFARGLDESPESKLGERLSALVGGNMTELALATRTEYARLFVGPRKVIAPLHESAWISGTRRMFTAETLEVRRFYEQHGYVMKAKNREPEDSIGVEFEFLRNLCDSMLALIDEADFNAQSLDKVRRLLTSQKTFEGEHLGRWADAFAACVIENDRSGYYAAWAAYLVDVLAEEEALVDEGLHMLGDVAGHLQPKRSAVDEPTKD